MPSDLMIVVRHKCGGLIILGSRRPDNRVRRGGGLSLQVCGLRISGSILFHGYDLTMSLQCASGRVFLFGRGVTINTLA